MTVSAPLHADFTTQVNGLDVQFASQSTGDVAAFMWDFGDGATSNEQNPLHTYAGGGTFTVTLTIGTADGRSDSRTLDVEVAAPVTAQFTSQIAGLDVQFTDQSSGVVIGYQWDFGDGATSNEQNPLHTYAGGGTFTVTLTVTDANGRSASISADVTLEAQQPTQAQPTLVDTTPILPDVNSLAGNLNNIFQTGLSTGKQATVFAKAGDSIFTQPNILSPFATAGQYTLNGSDDLQSVIDWFNQTDLNGTTSFNRLGVAVNSNWTVQALLDPNNADPSVCASGESPLACELRITQPSIMLVAVGQNDARNGTDPGAFQNTLDADRQHHIVQRDDPGAADRPRRRIEPGAICHQRRDYHRRQSERRPAAQRHARAERTAKQRTQRSTERRGRPQRRCRQQLRRQRAQSRPLARIRLDA